MSQAIAAALLVQFAMERLDLPHPLEPPMVSGEFNPYGRPELVCCQECHAPLTEREYDPDYSYDGEDEGGSSYSGGPGRCSACRDGDS